MITFFNRKKVYIGCDFKRFADIRILLADHHIRYDFHVRNRMGQWTGRGTLRGRTASPGHTETMYEYEVFVHKNDYDEAMYLIGQMRN